MMRVMPNVHRVRKKANRSAYVAIKHKNEIAVTCCGHVKRLAINYSSVEGIVVKLNVIVVIVARVQPVYYDHAHVERR